MSPLLSHLSRRARRKPDRRYCFSARSVRGRRSVSPGFDGTDDAATVANAFVVAMDDAATVRSAGHKLIDGRERRLPRVLHGLLVQLLA